MAIGVRAGDLLLLAVSDGDCDEVAVGDGVVLSLAVRDRDSDKLLVVDRDRDRVAMTLCMRVRMRHSTSDVGRVSYVQSVVEKEAESVLLSDLTSKTQLMNAALPE
jgi:hypothetical protein